MDLLLAGDLNTKIKNVAEVSAHTIDQESPGGSRKNEEATENVQNRKYKPWGKHIQLSGLVEKTNLRSWGY